MSVPMIPIDPEKRDDIYYRYKMPSIQTKVEGSGNGIKTVFPNIHDVCLAINRPEEILMKFFQSEIGAQRTVQEKDDKFLIMGSHTEERVQEKVYDFIRKFVLCRNCRNPETQISMERNKKGVSCANLSCGACGKFMKLANIDSRYITALTSYFAKNPQAATKKGTGTAEAREKENTATTAAGDAKNKKSEGEASASVPSAPIVVQKSDMADPRKPPQEILWEYMNKHSDNREELVRCSMELISQYNLKEMFGPMLVLGAIELSEKEFLTELRRHARLLRRFATLADAALLEAATDEAVKTEFLKREEELQTATIEECLRVCVRKGLKEKFPIALFVLFIESVLKSTAIVDWCGKEGRVSKVKEGDLKEIKTTCEPLVKWFTC